VEAVLDFGEDAELADDVFAAVVPGVEAGPYTLPLLGST
jgi:hypothetical protein